MGGVEIALSVCRKPPEHDCGIPSALASGRFLVADAQSKKPTDRDQ